MFTTFIEEGHLGRHLRRMRSLYAERQAALLAAAGRHLGGLLDVRPTGAGLHTVAWLPEGVDEEQVVGAAARLDVETRPLGSYRLESRGPGGLVLGFVAVPAGDLRVGVRRLAAALQHTRGR